MQTLTDAELMDAYSSRQDEGAFGELMRRHGAMVYRACHRLLKDAHEAEDASQAVFVVLARKAGGLRKGDLAAWLYRVAHLVAAETVRKRMHRAKREESYAVDEAIQTAGFAASDVADPALLGLVDAALLSLPERCREAVILRYLQNHSEAEAARRVGCAVGTLSSRASRGIERLRQRLAKRGVALGGVALAGLLTSEASAAVPETLLPSILATVKTSVATTATATTATSAAAMLAKGAMKAMFIAKVKTAALVTAAAVLLAATVSVSVEQLRDVCQISNITPAAGPHRTTVEDSQFWASPGMGQAHIGAQLITLTASDVARVETQIGRKFRLPDLDGVFVWFPGK
jgi:RNA polymerase sigma factor (sigma-70 family)